MLRPITDETIRTLKAEAERVGDSLLAALCCRAMGEDPTPHSRVLWSAEDRAWVDSTDSATARAEVERVIEERRDSYHSPACEPECWHGTH